MIRWILIVFLMLTGCAVQPEEIKGAVLMPYQIHYEKPDVPVMVQTIDYAQRNASFSSVFSHQYDGLNVSVSTDKKMEKYEFWDWQDAGLKFSISTYGVPFYQGQTYELIFNVSSSIADHVQVIFDDYINVLYQTTMKLNDQTKQIKVSYTHNGDHVGDGVVQLVFSKGNQTAGEIVIEEMSFRRVSGTDYHVKVNQVGYLPESEKLAVFKYNAGDWFDVVNVDNNEVVYTGQIAGRVENPDTGEVNYSGDFSEVRNEGTYRIVSQMGGVSCDFEIKEGLYAPLLNDAFNMITAQRCGVCIDASIVSGFEHEVCHHDLARGYSSWSDLDVSGGWHDAGDYGRYTLTAVKTINDLLMAHLVYPESFSDCMGISESGNGLSDVLDEAMVGLDWLMKMQNEWGGVYTAAVTTQFADLLMPEHDHQQLWVLDEENTSTASAAGAFALGYLSLKEHDLNKAETYLTCAIRAYDAASALRGQQDKKNPAEISAGDYANFSDADELYFASSILYAATHDERYLDEIQHALNSSMNLFGLSYDDFGGYGSYILLKDDEFKKTSLYSQLYNMMAQTAQNLVWDNVNDGYRLSIDSYHWGANMDVCNNAMMMLLIHDIAPSEDLVVCAFEQLSYLLGKNSINMSFVSGYGAQFPEKIHHRIAQINRIILPGALVGGPDGSHESDLPVAKKYWDDNSLYTMNEVAIYYNSPLVFVLSAFQ